MKVKQTISIDQEALKEAKHKAIDKNMSLSDYVEDAVKDKNLKERS